MSNNVWCPQNILYGLDLHQYKTFEQFFAAHSDLNTDDKFYCNIVNLLSSVGSKQAQIKEICEMIHAANNDSIVDDDDDDDDHNDNKFSTISADIFLYIHAFLTYAEIFQTLYTCKRWFHTIGVSNLYPFVFANCSYVFYKNYNWIKQYFNLSSLQYIKLQECKHITQFKEWQETLDSNDGCLKYNNYMTKYMKNIVHQYNIRFPQAKILHLSGEYVTFCDVDITNWLQSVNDIHINDCKEGCYEFRFNEFKNLQNIYFNEHEEYMDYISVPMIFRDYIFRTQQTNFIFAIDYIFVKFGAPELIHLLQKIDATLKQNKIHNIYKILDDDEIEFYEFPQNIQIVYPTQFECITITTKDNKIDNKLFEKSFEHITHISFKYTKESNSLHMNLSNR